MRKRKRRLYKKWLLLFPVLLFFVNPFLKSSQGFLTQAERPVLDSLSAGDRHADTSFGWNLILVNKENPIPDDYEMELTELSNGQMVDSRIYPELQAMFDEARGNGLQLFVREGYRTAKEQQRILEEKIESYENEGHSREEAERIAKEWVAVPGTSEHELGLSVDINADISVSSRDDVYTWLAENAYRYGFIKRYPSDKTELTEISNEPWHYRYVGKKAAKEMKEQGLCLEEYMEGRYTTESKTSEKEPPM